MQSLLFESFSMLNNYFYEYFSNIISADLEVD